MRCVVVRGGWGCARRVEYFERISELHTRVGQSEIALKALDAFYRESGQRLAEARLFPTLYTMPSQQRSRIVDAMVGIATSNTATSG